MKTLLRSLLLVLTFATTGLFAQAATAEKPAAPAHHQTVKKSKKGHKGHKKHGKKKKSGKKAE